MSYLCIIIMSPLTQEIAGKLSTRAVLKKAEAAVTTRYGCYMRYTDDGDDSDNDNDSDCNRENASPDGINRGGAEAMRVNLGSTNARRFV